MRFRYFDPLEQNVVEGALGGSEQVTELVGVVTGLRAECCPALEFADLGGSPGARHLPRPRRAALDDA